MADLEQTLKEKVLASQQKTLDTLTLMQQYLSTPAQDKMSRHMNIKAAFSAYKSAHETFTLAKLYNSMFYDVDIKGIEKNFGKSMQYTEDTLTGFYNDIRDVIEDYKGNDKGY